MRRRIPDFPALQRQRGFLLLALLLIIVLAGSSFVLAGLNTRQSVYLDQQKELHRQMEMAKTNLLAYVANTDVFESTRGPGFFPCPDTDHDVNGTSDTCAPSTATLTCTNPASLLPFYGRLPQYEDMGSGSRLPIGDYQSGLDQQFWYVVVPLHVYDDSHTENINAGYRTSSSCTRLTLDGNTSTNYVALIIAPGEALTTQDRTVSTTDILNYLDGSNNGTGYDYYSRYDSNPLLFNDQVIGISLDEYVKLVGAKVAGRVKTVLDGYYAAQTPIPEYPAMQTDFSSAFATTSIAWLNSSSNEKWADNITYTRTAADTATISFAGCSNIVFQLNVSSGITRSGATCL